MQVEMRVEFVSLLYRSTLQFYLHSKSSFLSLLLQYLFFFVSFVGGIYVNY